MNRLHLFELEDQPWFPALVRDHMTDFLAAISRAFRLYDSCLPVLNGLLEQTGQVDVVDLAAGGGGPWEGWLRRRKVNVRVTLTDRYPNLDTFRRLAESHPQLGYHPDPVEASLVPPGLVGVRTLFTALHHLPPDVVDRMLAQAVADRQPLAAFEFNYRQWFNLVVVPPTAWLCCWLLTPWIQPRTLSRWVLTYPLPLIPFAAAWDGFVSQLRAYKVDELQALAAPHRTAGYHWEVGQRTWLGLMPVTYLLGRPV